MMKKVEEDMENKELTLGSLFDGSGGFPLGGILAGINPVWSSEIEPFPIRVTTKRLPEMKHYGDVSTLTGSELEPVDVITFGSPCQDMSQAGKRVGLDGERSGLFHEAIRIVKEMRGNTDGRKPRYIVWENVPGAFTSNQGEDFRTVLEEVCGIREGDIHLPRPKTWPRAGEIVGNGYSVAWRQLDAVGWGVPQRRKRIYLVADLDGQSAGKILFESEGMSGYSAEGFRAWQEAARGSGKGTEGTGKAFSVKAVDGYNSSIGDVAATLGVNCGMSTGRNGVMVGSDICLNDQGGERMDVTNGETTTLRAEAHHPPIVLESAGFCTEHSAKARSVGYEEETAPTLRAGTKPAAVMFENHAQDARYKGPLEESPSLTARYGTGGNNQPLVVNKERQEPDSSTYDVRFTSEGTRNARQNCYETDTARTLDTGGNAPDSNQGGVAVVQAFGVCGKTSHSMMSDNPDSGFYEADSARTIDGNGGNPTCNQGGIAVVAIEGNGSRPSHKGPGFSDEGEMYTLNATEQHGVAYKDDRTPTYSACKNSFFTYASEEEAGTLVATDYKDPPLINEGEYIVRRLTPVECARLQGFPDWWCMYLGEEEPSEEELSFWKEAFETHRKVVTHAKKPKTETQIRKWLKDPHTDAAEYKLWGNGVALPCVYFVLAGIVWADGSNQEKGGDAE